ncbi:hypothetical protein BDV96DRAFT_607792 [Lophiotrema nucula]|uniref:Arrestin-like N-terminal domain-containing protein n=1 Tax=Lophiotrema nucula TaxID=690887 RepID=A0A6A5YFD7_9PLEO|nr:hypothetical protein BDV96DRAFT_607792 [Lophiotrema nucula]
MEEARITMSRTPNSETGPICIVISPHNRPVSATRATYTNDEIIDGKVHLQPSLRPSRVTVAFIGQTSIKVAPKNGRHHVHNNTAKVPLFSEQLEIDEPDCRIVPNGHVAIPCSFRFPSTAHLESEAHYSEHPLFEHTPHHTLPASYEYYGSIGHQIVEYYIEAAFITGEGSCSDQKVRQYITFRPSTVHSPSDIDAAFLPSTPQKISCRTHRLNPENKATKFSMRRFIHQLTHHDVQESSALFAIGTRIPSSVYAQAPLPVTVSLQHLRRSVSLRDPPPIYLRRIEVALFEKLRVRLPDKSLLARSDNVDEEHHRERPLLDGRFPAPGKVIHAGMGLHELGDTEIRVVPSFKTYGMALTYRIEVKLWIECAGEKYEIPAHKGDIEILPELRRPSDAQDDQMEDYGGIDDVSNLAAVDEKLLTPPPAYE